jgi:predicted DNA-binding protein (MmcQ/YjbR family)
MHCPCSNKIYANFNQHIKTRKHNNYLYKKHWISVIFDPDAEPIDDIKKLTEKCQEIYLEILINENIDQLIIIK